MNQTPTQNPSFNQLKKTLLDSGYEIRVFPQHTVERLALDAPAEVKRHLDSNIKGLTMPDENMIVLAEEQSVEERAVTLLHEMIHLFDDQIDEEVVEEMTLDMEQALNPNQIGFLQFLVA